MAAGATYDDAARFPQSDSHLGDDPEFVHDPEDDLIKQTLKRPIRLRNEGGIAQRTKENLEALGGVRNPKKAIQRLPNHKKIGQLALDAMMQVLYADAAIEDLILKALGDSTKANKGPWEEQIIRARKTLYKVLGISYTRRSRLIYLGSGLS